MLEVLLFGSPSFQLNGEGISPPTRKASGLVAYLTLEGESNREHLARLFWSGMGVERARRNLRQELYRLSTTPFGPEIEQDTACVRFRVQPETDVRRFRNAIQTKQFAEALRLHRGPLLENLRLSGASGFENWLERERTSLTVLRTDALAHHAATLVQAGEFRRALSAYLEVLEEDALQEHHHREAMWLHAMLGERSAALERFERLRRVLRREVGLEPLPETVALAERIRTGEGFEAVAVPEVVQHHHQVVRPFVGRVDALHQLEQARGLLVVTGEPGVGKTRLVLEFAQQRGTPLVLRGHEDASGTPFHPVVEAVREASDMLLRNLEPVWKREVTRLVPDLEPQAIMEPPTPEGRARFLEGLVRALLTLATSGGSMVLDDLHWFDSSSLEVVAHLVRRAADVRLLATARDTELLDSPPLTRLLESLERAGQLERIVLGPLSESDVGLLAQALARTTIPSSFAQRLHQTTAGNPFYTLETLRVLLEVNPDPNTLNERDLPIPETVRAAVLSRVDRLGPHVRRVLEAASLVGDAITPDLVAGSSALTDWEALDALERATTANLLEPRREGYRFSHDLVQRSLQVGLSDARRHLLHRKLAESLEGHDGSAVQIADHLERAGLAKRAVSFRVRAAEAATAVFAYREAITQYERALQDGASDHQAFEIRQVRTTLWEHLDDRTAWAQELEAMSVLAARLHDPVFGVRTTLARADLAFTSGQFVEVVHLTEPLLAQTQAMFAVRVRYRLGAALMHLGRAPEARSHFEAALSETPGTEPGWRGRIQHALAACAFDEDNLPDARMHVEAALQSLRIARDHSGEAASLNLKGHIAQRLGEPTARQELEVALARAREVGAVPVQLRALLNLAATTMGQGDFDAAMTYLEEGLALTREPQNPQLEAAYLMHLAALHWSRGDLGAVIDAASLALTLFDTLESARLATFNRVRLAGFLVECGDLTGARDVISQAKRLLERHTYPGVTAWLEAMTAHCEMAEGHAQVALERVERTLQNSVGIPDQFRQQLLWALAAAQLANHLPRAVLETVAQMDGSPEHRARGLSLRLQAQTRLRLRSTDMKAATELLMATSVPPVTKLHLYRALMTSLDSGGARGRAEQHRLNAAKLVGHLAETLEPGMRTGFLERWSDAFQADLTTESAS